jgi:ABC-type nitrate/sulfonate/bicarbonate transport system ATPase subunit
MGSRRGIGNGAEKAAGSGAGMNAGSGAEKAAGMNAGRGAGKAAGSGAANGSLYEKTGELAELILTSDEPFGVYGADAAQKEMLLARLAAAGMRVSLMPDPIAYCPWATVFHNVKFAWRLRYCQAAPGARGKPGGFAVPAPGGARGRRSAEAALIAFELEKYKSCKPGSLPVLPIKELGLAMAYVQAPDAFALENPTSGLDKAEAALLISLIKNHLPGNGARRGLLLLFTDKYDEIERMCARFSVFAPGEGGAPVVARIDDALSKSPSLREFVEGL